MTVAATTAGLVAAQHDPADAEPAAQWLHPDWPVPAHVGAVCSTRVGGRSAGPYAGFNLGDHVGDDPRCVAGNRARLAQAIGARPVFLRQVHGSAVLRLDALPAETVAADASTTDRPGLACTVLVADCLPLLLCDAMGRRVAAVHVGWRGLAAGVVEAALACFGAGGQIPPVLAWLGPCIGPRAFQVGPEVRAAITAGDAGAQSCFTADGGDRFRADLPALVRRRLVQSGVRAIWGNDGGDDWCTVSRPSLWFSHRRDDRSGRMAASVWLRH